VKSLESYYVSRLQTVVNQKHYKQIYKHNVVMSNSSTSSAQLLDNFMVTAQIHKVTSILTLVSIYNCKLPVHCMQLLPWGGGAYKILWKHSSTVSQQQCWSYRKRFNLSYHRQNGNKQRHNATTWRKQVWCLSIFNASSCTLNAQNDNNWRCAFAALFVSAAH